ncbi:MAG: transposase [Nitrospirota bacterium]
MKKYDYSCDGMYFVTICAWKKACVFEDDIIASIIKEHWQGLPKRFNCIELDEFLIMPNHIHFILFIVGAIHELPLQNESSFLHQKQRRQMMLPKIIGWFKMNCAKQINLYRKTPGYPVWQRNYYEHIIRNEYELNRIRQYIIENQFKWDEDPENPKNTPVGAYCNTPLRQYIK